MKRKLLRFVDTFLRKINKKLLPVRIIKLIGLAFANDFAKASSFKESFG